MTKRFRFGLRCVGRANTEKDISRRFQESLAFVRLADQLGFDSITKTAHYSAHPIQMLQLVPMLARFAAEGRNFG
jgi:alkanesulfonate monooxygenase SsuD/methylene tetrahydromethanopterin reductase-like flavin-dependent oxidoreductase (luciferase family)